jgi:hypothetical protein
MPVSRLRAWLTRMSSSSLRLTQTRRAGPVDYSFAQ